MEPPTLDARCQNCQEVLAGPFCHGCGQRDVDLRANGFALFSEWGSNMVRLDGRLLRTLPLYLLHPHRLARSYMDGKRSRFTPPLRLILTGFSVGVLILLLSTQVTVDDMASHAVVEGQHFIMEGKGGEFDVAFELPEGWRIRDNIDQLRENTSAAYATRIILQMMLRSTSLAMMLMIPVLCALLKIFYWRTPIVEHLVFAALAQGSAFVLFSLGMLVSSAVAWGLLVVLPVQIARHQWAQPDTRRWTQVLRIVLMVPIHGVLSVIAWLVAVLVSVYRL